MSEQPRSIHFSLPAWLDDYLGQPAPFATVEERMAFVIGAARRNVEKGTGGPFGAGVFEVESGRLMALGVNLVTAVGLSMLHAEMVAISLAQRRLGVYDLGAPGLPALELVSSAEPCAMCCGAIPWSGVGRLVYAAREADVRGIGFDEGDKAPDWRQSLGRRGIEVIPEVMRTEATDVLAAYAAVGGGIYNASPAPR